MKRRIAHFLFDDKFAKCILDTFDSIEEYESRYYTVTTNTSFSYIDSQRVEIIHPDNLLNIISDYQFCDILILHSLYAISVEEISKIHKNIVTIWFSWGYDIYNNPFPDFPLIKIKNQEIATETSLLAKLKNFWRELKQGKNKLICYYRYGGKEKRKIFEAAVHRIDYYSGVFPEEYDLLKKRKIFRAKPFQYNYVENNDLFLKDALNEPIPHPGNNIQVGHNGFAFLNHIDAFRRLSKISINNRKVICPLSYCAVPEYLQKVLNEGKLIFKENFVPILDFMPREKYLELLSSVGYIVLNVKRQCGVGNIMIGIWHGAKIFMPKNSINYKHFEKMGVKVFTIEEDLNEKELNSGLTEDEIYNNRKIINDYYRFDRVRERLISSLDSIHYNNA